jgi:5-methylcytosine-specific restriction endonuclease McrA
MTAMSKRKAISDRVAGMLNEEVVYICPLGLSRECERFEKIETAFTNQHIDSNSANSEYWNLIRICEPCHKEHNQRQQDGNLERKIRLKKKNLALQYFGPLAVSD